MRRPARLRLLGGGWALLALLGLWVAHTLEYVRVWGVRGLDTVLFGSVHAYMLPVFAVLVALGSVAGIRGWRAWVRLGGRLDRARLLLRAALRGRRVPRPLPRTPSLPSHMALAWPLLTLMQVLLYLLQENVEAAVAGLPGPGLGAITGVHALAVAVHAGVALVLLIGVAVCSRLVRARVAAVRRLEGALAHVLERLRGDAPPRADTDTDTPAAGWVPRLQPRAPPVLIGC